jgi:hypothetical protein
LRWSHVQVNIGLAAYREGGAEYGTDDRDGFIGEEFTVKMSPIREVVTYLGMGVDLVDDGKMLTDAISKAYM